MTSLSLAIYLQPGKTQKQKKASRLSKSVKWVHGDSDLKYGERIPKDQTLWEPEDWESMGDSK